MLKASSPSLCGAKNLIQIKSADAVGIMSPRRGPTP